MQELNPNQSRFFNKWTLQRENRWKYRFLHGSVYIMLLGLIILITSEKFKIAEIHPFALLLYLSICAGVGLLFGNNDFKRKEAIYQQYLLADNQIELGVDILIKEKLWVFENLTLQCDDEHSLIVRNNLFWLKTGYPTEKKRIECLNILQEDLNRLRANKVFRTYAESKRIKLELFNNEDKSTALAERFI